jgi:hypothetical protein
MDTHPRSYGQYRGMKKTSRGLWIRKLPAVIVLSIVLLMLGGYSALDRLAGLNYLGYPESLSTAILHQNNDIILYFLDRPFEPSYEKLYSKTLEDGALKEEELALLTRLYHTYPHTFIDQNSVDFFFQLLKIPDWEIFFNYPLPLSLLDKLALEANMMELSEEEVCLVNSPHIPVLMYHKLDNSKQWIDEKSFLWQLEQLNKADFSTIRADAFMKGDFSAFPEGRKPILLTFDDGRRSQFQLLENGKADPKSGVGMMESFAEKYPAFGKNAVFYLYFTVIPFENIHDPTQWKTKITYLQENGFEIGNHTFDHQILTKFKPEQVKKTLDQFYQVLESLPACKIEDAMTLCYPGGEIPMDRSGIEQYRYKEKPLLGAFTAWEGRSLIPIHPKADKYNLPRYDGNDEHVKQIVQKEFFRKKSHTFMLPRFYTSSLDSMKFFLKEHTNLLQHDLIWKGNWINRMDEAQRTEDK